jgi:hypothetical protein
MIKKGQSVKVKPNMKDYENANFDISGWQGRVVDIHDDPAGVFVEIQLDSITLRNLPEEYIEESINEDLDYENYIASADDLIVCEPRDTEADVHKAQEELTNEYFDMEYDEEDEADDKAKLN